MGCLKLHTEDYFLPLRVVRGGVYKKIRVNARDIGAAEKMENGEKKFLLKDHLGNVRVVITEEQQQDIYPAATLEDVTYNGGTAISQEQKFYDINPAKIALRAEALGIPNYTNQNTPAPPNNNPNSNTGANSAKLYKLNSASNLPADKMGLGITLKVMAGDRIDVAGKSYYFQQTPAGQGGNYLLQLADVLTGFLGGASGAGATSVHGAVTPAQINPGTSNPSINSLLNTQTSQSNSTPNNPRAFINVIFFDEQFNAVDFRVSKVGDANVLKENHLQDLQNLIATKSGFVYVYVSNESPVNVFFDNVQVVHTRGALLSEDHYYPFGLTMAGISSKAAGSLENKRKWNGGSELQSKEFSDGSGLELYATQYRSLDPQIGRFWQIDPKPNPMISLYASMDNNPIRYSDPLGDTVLIRHKGKDIIYNDGALTNKDGSAYGGKVKGFLKKTVNALNAGRTGSAEAKSTISELQGSKNNFTIVKGSTNKFDYNGSQRIAAYANQIKTDPAQTGLAAIIPAADLLGGSGGTITWNPSGDNVWTLGGGQDNNPAINLMHELNHGRDANRGLLDDRDNSGINRNEWQASYKENIIRQQMGQPLREYYRSQDNGGVITPLAPRLLDATNNPIIPTWVPASW